MSRYPDIISGLPEADAEFKGVKAWLLRGPTASAIFVEACQDAEISAHSHGAPWGIVVDGELDLTTGEARKSDRRGEEYFIPSGVRHSARLMAGVRVIDFFGDPDRYRLKTCGVTWPARRRGRTV